MTKTIATILAAFALSLAAAPAAPAHACGGDMQSEADRLIERAAATVDASFAAIAAGDTKAFKKLWSRDARVTSKNASGKGQAHSSSVKKALKKWLARRAEMSWTVESVTPTFDGAEVHATVTWAGTTYDDVLQLRDLGDGRMVIIDKVTTARAAVEASSGY